MIMKALLLTASVGGIVCGLGADQADAKKTGRVGLTNNTVYGVSDGRTVYGGANGRTGYQQLAVGSWIQVVGQANGGAARYIYVQAGTYLDGDSALNQDSTVITETQVTRVATGAQMSMISRRIDNVMGTQSQASAESVSLTGGNSGPDSKNRNVWAEVGFNDIAMTKSELKWDANLFTAAIGTDRKLNDKIIGGLALTFSYLNGKTKYNHGNIGDYAYGIVPYASFKVTNKFSIDAMAGYNYVQKHRDRISREYSMNCVICYLRDNL